MTTLYLHVGPHKTGSTYLQYTFAKRFRHARKQGLEYPYIGREVFYGHHNIAYFVAQRALLKTNSAKLSKGLQRLASLDTNILLSSEEFSKIPADKLVELKRIFPQHNFHVLYFLRKGSRFIFSLWQQTVRMGMTTPLDKFDLPAAIKFFKYDPFDHDGNINRFTQNLGADVSILDYNQLVSGNKDLLDAVSAIMNVKIRPYRKSVYEGLTVEEIELVRAANLYNLSLKKTRSPFAGTVCGIILKIPWLGSALKKNIAKMTIERAGTMTSQKLIEMGFDPSNFSNADLEKSFTYIPDRILLDELNKDNILSWRIVKKIIETKRR